MGGMVSFSVLCIYKPIGYVYCNLKLQIFVTQLLEDLLAWIYVWLYSKLMLSNVVMDYVSFLIYRRARVQS